MADLINIDPLLLFFFVKILNKKIKIKKLGRFKKQLIDKKKKSPITYDDEVLRQRIILHTWRRLMYYWNLYMGIRITWISIVNSVIWRGLFFLKKKKNKKRIINWNISKTKRQRMFETVVLYIIFWTFFSCSHFTRYLNPFREITWRLVWSCNFVIMTSNARNQHYFCIVFFKKEKKIKIGDRRIRRLKPNII